MNSRFLLGRALHKGDMRIVRRVAASFIKFLIAFLRELGAFFPVYIIFIIVFSLGMAYADYTFIKSLSELSSRGSELNSLCGY
jgi:hypothetical protein